jgi:ketosteroid isomerase-like protein
MTNLDIVKRSYEAFARDDMEGVLGDMHPEIEWHQAQGLPHGGFYQGLDEVKRNIFDPLDDEWWDGFTADPEVVVVGRYRGTAKATRKQLDVPFVHIWTIEGEKAIRFRQYLDTAGWVNALEG